MSRWDWAAFKGSPLALKFAKRDLPTLVKVIGLVPQHRVCLQAGGSLGIWPKRLAVDFERVLTCEPDPDNYVSLLLNAPELNITAYPVALGERRQKVGLCRTRRDGKPTNHDGCVHVAGSGEIPMATIDDFQLAVCDLIYLDIEGYEYFALRGASETLRRCRPVVVTEINQHLGEYGCSEAEMTALMAEAGYRAGYQFGADRVWLPKALERAA